MVNEQTLHQQISHWRMVVLANQRQISPETLALLKRYVEQGGTLVVTDGSLRSGEQDSLEAVELLGVSRTAWKDQGRQSVDIGGQVDATDKMLGVLFTGWSAGGNGEHLLAAWKDRDGREKPPAKSQETAHGIAAVIKAGLPELDR